MLGLFPDFRGGGITVFCKFVPFGLSLPLATLGFYLRFALTLSPATVLIRLLRQGSPEKTLCDPIRTLPSVYDYSQ